MMSCRPRDIARLSNTCSVVVKWVRSEILSDSVVAGSRSYRMLSARVERE